MKVPCRYCEERKINCHSKCPRYLEFREYRERLNREKFKETEIIIADIDRHYTLYRMFRRKDMKK